MRGLSGISRNVVQCRRIMFFKFIVYCILAYLAIRFVRKLLSPPVRGSSRATPREPTPSHMIRCENCGMFITQTSALLVGGREFCSSACAHKVKSV
jgi:hypothetical protein